MYWYGVPHPVTRDNLATCIWESRAHAIAAHTRPYHTKAVRLAATSYEMYTLERYTLRKGMSVWPASILYSPRNLVCMATCETQYPLFSFFLELGTRTLSIDRYEVPKGDHSSCPGFSGTTDSAVCPATGSS